MIKQSVIVNGKVEMVDQSILTKKDDGTFYDRYNEDMSIDTTPDVGALYNQAKISLALALSADIESGGYTWQVRNSIDLANIQKVIDQNDRANYPSGTTQSFRMADNTWQDLTIDYFHQVLSDEAVRTKAIYDAYRVWTEGDMKEEFKV